MNRKLKNKLKYEGSIIPHDKYGDIVLVEYQTTEEVTARFVNTGFTVTTSLSNLLRGFVKDRLHPTVYGVGVLGNEKCMENGCYTKEYNLWQSMLQRCYCPLYLKERPTYKDCSVSDDFKYLETFKKWCHSQFNYNEVDDDGIRFVLDKDILVKGNNIYSKDTCCFVPREVNLLFVKADKSRGSLPIGVSYHKRINKYSSTIRIGGGTRHLGYFSTTLEAFQVYKQAKEASIKEVAEKWKSKLTKETYDAMINYVVGLGD